MLKTTVDRDCNCLVYQYDSLNDVGNPLVEAEKKDPNFRSRASFYYGNEWTGRTIRSYAEFSECLNQPWQEGLRIADLMAEELKKEIKPPTNIKRRRIFSESDGDVNVDRAMRGESAMFDLIHKTPLHGVKNVAIITNIDAAGMYTGEQMFWRGAVSVAIIDLLEEAGYSCELWTLEGGLRARLSFPENYATFGCLKRAGDVLDKDCLIKGVSAWFTRVGLFGLPYTNEKYKFTGNGRVLGWLTWFDKYIDKSSDMMTVEMPIQVFDHASAVQAAKDLINKVTGE